MVVNVKLKLMIAEEASCVPHAASNTTENSLL